MKTCPECQSQYSDDVEFCAKDGMKLRVAFEQAQDPLIGKALDNKWVIEDKIGEGGMGAVYKGYQRGVNRKIAVKTLRANLVDSQEFVDRFFREGRVATTIANPHCVTIYDYGQAPDGTLFLAMEYLDGKPLSDVLTARRLSQREALKVGVQISAALAAAHAQRIVHRDLKPDNIFLLHMPDQSTFAKVLDFGIAKDNGAATEKYTRTGQIFGTPAYMSPEQCTGSPLDGRSDLYALGVILYEIVSQATPFGGKTTSPMKILLDHVNTAPPQLDAHQLGISPGFAAAIMRLLEKSPDARFPDAQALQHALEDELALLDSLRATGQLNAPRPPTAQIPHAAPTRDAQPVSPYGATASVELPAALAQAPAPQARSLGPIAAVLIVLVLIASAAAFAVYKNNLLAADPQAPVADAKPTPEPPAPAKLAPPDEPTHNKNAPEPGAEEPAPVEPTPVEPTPVVEATAPDMPPDEAPPQPDDKKPADAKKVGKDKKPADKKPDDDKKPADDKKPVDIKKNPKDKTDQMVDELGI